MEGAEEHQGRAPSFSVPRWRDTSNAVVLVVIAVLAGIDAIGDLYQGVPFWNVALDLALTGCALVAGLFFVWRLLHARYEARELLRRLGTARADAAHWQEQCAKVVPELGAAIVRQFARWSLTPEEQEVALLVLGGLSPAQIAERLRWTETEVLHRSSSLYRKAGVAGPSALSAFFLRDLLFLAGQRLPRRAVATDLDGDR